MARPRASGRLESIQVLRGIAAVLVVFTHACNLVFASPEAQGHFYIGSAGQFRGFGAVGVDLFFIISGFVMAFSVSGKPEGWRGAWYFLRLRWIRIAPPYLLVTAVLTAALLVVGRFDWRGLANAVLFVPFFDVHSYSVPPLSIGWTLSFEFSFYLLVALAVLLRRSRQVWLVGLAIAALVLLGLVLEPGVFVLGWFLNPIFLEFGFGILAYVLWTHGVLARLRVLWGVLGAAAALLLVAENVTGFGGIADMAFTLDGSLSLQRVLVWGVPCLFVYLGCVALWRSVGTGLFGRTLTTLGDSSYSIYLAHLPVLIVFGKLLDLSGVRMPADLLFALVVVLGVVAGLVYYRLFERPVTKALRSWVERRGRERAERSGAPSAASG